MEKQNEPKESEVIDLVTDDENESVTKIPQEVPEEDEVEVVDLTENEVRSNQNPVRVMNNGIILEEMNPFGQNTNVCVSPFRVYQNGLTLEDMFPAQSPDQSDQPPMPMGPIKRALQRIREKRILSNLHVVQSSQATPRLVLSPRGLSPRGRPTSLTTVMVSPVVID